MLAVNLKGKYLFKDLSADGRKILKRILKKQDRRVCLGFICLETGIVVKLL
jgi:hypothetical protein